MTGISRSSARHFAVSLWVLSGTLFSAHCWATLPPPAPVGQYCVEADCYSTFEQALARVKHEAGGHEIRAAGQELSFDLTFPPPPATQPISVPVQLYYFESPPLPVDARESIAYGHRSSESQASVEPPFPCDGPLYPFLAPKCPSEQQLVEGLGELLEHYHGGNYVPASVSGSWDTVVDPVNPFIQQTPLYLEEGERFPIVRTWSGKMAKYRVLTQEGVEQRTEEYPIFRHDVYSCPVGRIWGGGEYSWPVICIDPITYVIKRRIDYGCDPCTGSGADVSRAAYTTHAPLVSVDGMTLGLRYDSVTRAWTPSFEPRIMWAYNFGPGGRLIVLRLKSGAMAQLIDQGNSTFGVEGREGDIVVEHDDGTYTYYSDGEEYFFDEAGQLSAFGPPGAPSAKLVRDDGETLSALILPGGRRISFEYIGTRLSAVIGPDQWAALEYDEFGNLVRIDREDSALEFVYGEANLAAGGDRNLLTGLIDEMGHRVKSLGYDEAGRLTSVSDGSADSALTTHYAYPSATEVTEQTPLGDTRTFTLSGNSYRRPLAVANGAGSTSSQYDTNERLSRHVDARGVEALYTYTDAFNSSRTEAVGTPQQSRIEEERDQNHGQLLERRVHDDTDAVVSQETWAYNARGQLTVYSRISPSTGAARTTITYCEQPGIDAGACPLLGLVTSVDGPRTDVGDQTSYVYYFADYPYCATMPEFCLYRKGDLRLIFNAQGRVVTEVLAYDGAGRPLSVRDANNVITDFEYHPRGWMTARKVRGPDGTTEADDRITSIGYYPTGLVSSTTLPDGSFTSYVYDAAHRLTDIVDADGNRLHYTLDNAGNRIKEEVLGEDDSLKRTLSRIYNQLGQLATQADAGNNPTDFTYDANGNLKTVTDALDRVMQNDYDPLNRLIRTLQDVDGIEAGTAFEYDAPDNLTKVTDPKGLETDYTYNAFGDLTQLDSPDTGTTTYEYDDAGNRTSQTDARGMTTTYGYDVLNRLVSITYTDASLNVDYTYDTSVVCLQGERFGVGRLTRVTDSSGATHYCYDRFGQLVRKVQATNGQLFTLRYEYTKAGQLQRMTYPDGTAVDYVRDGQGRTTEVGVTAPGGSREVLLTDATWYPFGPVGAWTFGNGRTHSRTLDLDYRPQSILSTGTGTGGLDLGFGFDPAGNLTSLHGADRAEPPRVKLDYDALNRLTGFRDGPTDTVIEGYTYDATGNRTAFTNSAGSQTYAYPASSHRLSSAGATTRTYDLAGNTTQIGATARQFVYDATGRMRQVKANNVVTMNYQYNGRGEQVRKHLGTANTYTLYDEAGHWLGDYDSTGAAVQQAIWMDDLPVGLIANGNQLHYIQPDHLGTPRVVVEVMRNVPVWRWDMKGEAFGDTVPNQDPDGDGTAFVFNMRFPGQRFDAASGLNYNYFRDYEPSTGRYVQSDPIGLGGGINTYAYVGGNPISLVDPLGLTGCVVSFPGYPITIPGTQTSLPLVHAGALSYGSDGKTRYYEYGRYGGDFGAVERRSVPDLKKGEDGNWTPESVQALKDRLREIGKEHEAHIECDKDADADKINDYAEKVKNDANRPAYNWNPTQGSVNTCLNFAIEAVRAGR